MRFTKIFFILTSNINFVSIQKKARLAATTTLAKELPRYMLFWNPYHRQSAYKHFSVIFIYIKGSSFHKISDLDRNLASANFLKSLSRKIFHVQTDASKIILINLFYYYYLGPYWWTILSNIWYWRWIWRT